MANASDSYSGLTVIVGLGATGLSCARYLKEKGETFAVNDTRLNPPQLEQFKQSFPGVKISLGQLDEELLLKADRVILSPGLSLKEPAIQACLKNNIEVIGDIELFTQAVTKPVIAITGTNAKSTVTTLVAEMAKEAGCNVQVGGNLGLPVLDMLHKDGTDLYVLELSSFQLETTYHLQPKVAALLNVSPDHMDRYDDLADYQRAKLRIFNQCQTAVYNGDDALTSVGHLPQYRFTFSAPGEDEFGLRQENGRTFLAFGEKLLLDANALSIAGRHHQSNALAALAIGHAYGLPFSPMLEVLKTFKGLPHRCQPVREYQGVKWIDDSKGTNVGATRAAIEGIGPTIPGKLILIAGGLGKNADFTPLLSAITQYVRHVVLIGEAADDFAALLKDQVTLSFAEDMQEAVQQCVMQAKEGDIVLLSPACASFDMFDSFAHRGEVFSKLVNELS